MGKHCTNCKYEKLMTRELPCRYCTLNSRWEPKSDSFKGVIDYDITQMWPETIFNKEVVKYYYKDVKLMEQLYKQILNTRYGAYGQYGIERREEMVGFKNFKVTNVSVDCGFNVVPVAEITVDGSLADVTPRGIDRVVKTIENALNSRQSSSIYMPVISKVIHNNPDTIVFWEDGTKTVVKCQDGDIYDPEKGLAMAISKKALGNQGNYCEVFKKWLPEEEVTIDLANGPDMMIGTTDEAIEMEFRLDPETIERITGGIGKVQEVTIKGTMTTEV